MVNEQLLKDLPKMTDTELWSMFRDLHEDGEVPHAVYEDVRMGWRHLPFHILFYNKYKDKEDDRDNWVRDLPNQGKVKIGKLRYHVHDVLEEEDRRRSIMRRWILKFYSEEDNESKGRYT